MTIRVGVAIDDKSIAVVALKRGAIIFQRREAVTRERALVRVKELLTRLRRNRFDRVDTRVCLGPSLSMLRTIEGIPADLGMAVACRALNENPERFFLKAGAGLVVTPPVSIAGRMIAAALDRSIVDEIRSDPDLQLNRVAAATSVIGQALAEPTAELLWRFDSMITGIRFINGVAFTAYGSKTVSTDIGKPLVAALTELGFDFAAAYGAASADYAVVPHLGKGDLRAGRMAASARSRVVAVAVLAASFAILAFAPGSIAERTATKAKHQLQLQDSVIARYSVLLNRSRERSALQQRVDKFRAGRRSIVSLLATLTAALPESTAVTALRVDSAGGTLALLARSGLPAVRAIASDRSLENVRVTTPVAREIVSGREMERVSLRFRFPAAPATR